MAPTSWDQRFLALLEHIASWSHDPSTKTGSVVVEPESRRVLSLGYNGFPKGVEDSPVRYLDRELKLRLVVHAEHNAVLSAGRAGVSLIGSTIYASGPPCSGCMKAIIQAGLKRVAWAKDNKFENDPATLERWGSEMAASMLMAAEAGLILDRIDRVV